jgi:hypothetical protein
MEEFKIHCLVGSSKYLLIVFHTDEKCWQFRIVTADGCTRGEQKIYYTPEAALSAGRQWLKT